MCQHSRTTTLDGATSVPMTALLPSATRNARRVLTACVPRTCHRTGSILKGTASSNSALPSGEGKEGNHSLSPNPRAS